MSKLKSLLIVLMVTVIVLMHVSSYAISALLNNNKIQISEFVTAENGNITTDATNYDLYYQWVEIDNSTYNQLKKLRSELQIIQYYNIYIDTFDEDDHDIYESAQEAYKATYGDYFSDINDERVDINESKIISLLPNYTDDWTKATNNQYSIDLSTFNGVQDFVLWVKLAETSGTTSYNAEIFELTGTKQDETPAVTPTPGEEQTDPEDNEPTPGNDEDETEGTDVQADLAILDPYNNILISSVSENGTGSVNIVGVNNYTLFSGYVEIDEELYNQIKKLEDELEVIEAFNIYDTTLDEDDYNNYYVAQQAYKAKYGTYVYDGTDERIDTIESIRDSLLLTKPFTGIWALSTNNSKNFFIDPTTYNGTKYFISWIKLQKQNGDEILDGEIQKLVGTKGEEEVTPTPTTPAPSPEILDPYNNIIIHEATDGKGTIEVIGINKPYDLYYQWVEIDEPLYRQIRQLEDELKVIEAFNIYDTTLDQEDYDNYYAAQQAYKAKYGTYVYDGTDERIDIIESTINSLFLTRKYGNDWIKTDDNTYEMDLSKFTGTKYYILWAKLVKPDGKEIYDAEVFEFTGTKTTPTPVEPTPTPVTPTPTPVEPTPTPVTPTPTPVTPTPTPVEPTPTPVTPTPTPVEPTPTPVTPTPTPEEKDDDGKKELVVNPTNNTTANGRLPQTGIDGSNIALIGAMVGLSTVSVVSFIKYRRIK